MREAVIVSTARTPIGKAFRGAFNATPSPTLAGIGRTGLDYANWMAEMKHWESLASFLRRTIG